MKNFLKPVLFSSASILFLEIGISAPMYFSKCQNQISITSPKGGAGVYFDEACRMAYVLPPTTGTLRIEAMAKTSGLSECKTLNSFTEIFEMRAKKLSELARKGLPKKSSPSNGGSPLFPEQPEQPSRPSPTEVIDNIKYLDELEKLQEAYVKSRERLRTFWSMPGATAQISYRINHQQLVESYKQRNPHVQFAPMPLRSAKIYLARKIGANESSSSVPAVLYSTIPGARKSVFDDGEIGNDEGVISGDAQSGQLGLSLFGACPYYDSDSRSFPENLNSQELTAHMTANVRYSYELQAHRNYKLKYQLGAFVSKLSSSESKGGFFSSKTINKLIVEEKSEDWFDIKVESEDGRFVYDNDFAQLMKAQVIDRAIRYIARLIQGEPIEAPRLSTPNPNGAEVAAKELQKCPYVYCQAGAAILNVANAIFGSGQSVAEFVKRHDTWVQETSSEKKPLKFEGTVDFLKK